MSAPTFADMRAQAPFDLAAWWGDRTRWPIERGATDPDTGVVCELAVMSALGQWLRDWVPISIHRALRGGATLDQVAEATGLNTSGVFVEWTQWAVGQRQLYESTPPGRAPVGLSPGEYEQVRAMFTTRRTTPAG